MNRNDILIAATGIFSKKGFHAASMADIAEAVHLKKASLYHHVSSKQEILFGILEMAIQIGTEAIQKIVETDLPAEEKLRKAMIAYFRLLADHNQKATVLLLEYRSLSEEYRVKHIQKRDAFEKLWKDILKEGIRTGEFKTEFPELAAKDLLGMINWSITWFKPDGELAPEEIAIHCANAYLNGLRATK